MSERPPGQSATFENGIGDFITLLIMYHLMLNELLKISKNKSHTTTHKLSPALPSKYALPATRPQCVYIQLADTRVACSTVT